VTIHADSQLVVSQAVPIQRIFGYTRTLMADQPLNRESLLNGDVARLFTDGRSDIKLMPDDERMELVQTTIDNAPSTDAFWVFAYGSLIWNPAIEFAEQRRCIVDGYQRKFCFWTTMSRGTDEPPGLMMGLIDGNRCRGLAYRISKNKLHSELDILFRREMSSYVYNPTWVVANCSENQDTFNALTFVVDTNHDRYIDKLDEETLVSTIATAKGPLGKNCDYLFQLSERLTEMGYNDSQLEDLEKKVRMHQERC